MPVANRQEERLLRRVAPNAFNAVGLVVSLPWEDQLSSIADFMHEVVFLDPSVIHFFILAQALNVAMNEAIVVRVVNDLISCDKLASGCIAIAGWRWSN